jgi:hypothetical protein
MAGSSSDIFLHVAGLLDGDIDLIQFQRWFAAAAMRIERDGTDAEVDFSNRVENLLAELTGDHISAGQFLDALREERQIYAPDRELAVVAEAWPNARSA